MKHAEMLYSEEDVLWWRTQSQIPGSNVTTEEADASVKLYLDAKEFMQEVREAFKGVTLGNGIGILEADCMDPWGVSEEERQRLRALDERFSWEEVSRDHLRRVACGGYSVLDKLGMRFHLPAYILADFREDSEHHFLYQLYYRASRLSIFEQRINA